MNSRPMKNEDFRTRTFYARFSFDSWAEFVIFNFFSVPFFLLNLLYFIFATSFLKVLVRILVTECLLFIHYILYTIQLCKEKINRNWVCMFVSFIHSIVCCWSAASCCTASHGGVCVHSVSTRIIYCIWKLECHKKST